MIRRLSVAAVLLASFLVMALPAETVQVRAPASTVLGDAIAISVNPLPGIESMRVELVDAAGVAVGASPAFPLEADRRVGSWVALLGVPTTIEPGHYHLLTIVRTAGGADREQSPIVVAGRSFRHEDIDLNQDLSLLQKENTAAKTRQAQELWHILTRFHEHAVYQTGPLIVPVTKYFVSSPYGERRLFVFAHGGSQRSIHQGIDLGVDAGTPIMAAGAGRVMFAGPMIMTGNSAVIEQLPGVYSLYFHMERLLVQAGEVVKQGQTIGYAGSTGLATGPHLHWQVEVDGVAVNPMSLLKRGLVQRPPAVVRAR